MSSNTIVSQLTPRRRRLRRIGSFSAAFAIVFSLLITRIHTVEEPSRIWSDRCSESDIVISQGATTPLPNGIPTYTVEIMNVCTSSCDISGIHVSCGWFSSARVVNPRVFKRLRFNDCLVNDGKPLPVGRTLSFQYANTYRYPLSITSVKC